MYQAHFHLQGRPFASATNPEHYFPASSIEQAREVIALNIERVSGATMLTGPVGSGKTLVCELIKNQFSSELPICMITGARFSAQEMLLQSILHALGLPYQSNSEGELRLTLTNHISSQACVHGILLIVDEADRLPLELLEEIRVLTNLIKDGQPRVRLLLAGSPKLEELVGHPKLESLNQRIVGRLYLENFTQDETRDYIAARINACGGDAMAMFEDDALATVHRATHGVPRLVNQVCDHALLIAAIADIQRLDKACIEEAWADLQQLPLPLPDESEFQSNQTADSDVVIEFGALDEHEVAIEANVEDEMEASDTAARDVHEFTDDEHSTSESSEELDDIQRAVAELGSEASQAATGLQSPNHVEIEIDSEASDGLDDVANAESGMTSFTEEPHSVHDSGLHFDVTFGTDAIEIEHDLAIEEEELVVVDDANVVVDLTMDQAANPFDEEFQDEEVVIQQFATASQFVRNGYEPVTSSYSRHLAEQLSAAHPGLRMHDPRGEGYADPHAESLTSFGGGTGAGFRPLSAYLGDGDELTIDDSVESELTLEFAADPFEPSQDPVLPEPSVRALIPEADATGDWDDAFEDLSAVPPEFSEQGRSEVSIVFHESLSTAIQNELQIDSANTTSDRKPTRSRNPKSKKVFRTLFTNMRSR